jgi:thioester reductase-like protein
VPTVLLTGFPGFLGSELLPRLLHRDDGVRATCLVQDRFLPLARRRIEQLAAAEASLAGRIDLVEGDITRPDLGLGTGRATLTRDLAEVYHLAAVYDLEVDPGLAERFNVDGTRHVLDLCADSPRLERLHHVSTCYVSGRWAGIFRETDLEKGQRFNNAYEETKHRSEVLVARARADGMPATVYRPSVVGGDSETGATQKYDGPYFIIRWLLKQGPVAVMPMVGDAAAYRFNVVPRDYVVDGITALSGRADTVGGTYALADAEPFTVGDLVGLLGQQTGKRLVTARLPRRLAKGALRRVPGVEGLLGIPPAAVDYFTHPTHYTDDEAAPLLAQEGVTLPDRERWFAAMVAHVRAHPDVPSAAMV